MLSCLSIPQMYVQTRITDNIINKVNVGGAMLGGAMCTSI